MITILEDRLFHDTRLKLLAVELGCPFLAMGVLPFLWHGTQNSGLFEAKTEQILATFPNVTKAKSKKILDALVKVGWLEKTETGYLVIGNEKHVQGRERAIKKATDAARKRWDEENARSMPQALPQASSKHGTKTSRVDAPSNALPFPSPSLPYPTEEEGSSRDLSKAQREPPPTQQSQSLALAPPPKIPPPPENPPPQAPPPETDPAVLAVAHVPVSQAKALWDVHQTETQKRGQARAPFAVGMDMYFCRVILVKCQLDLQVATCVMEAYVRHNGNEFWKANRWALSWLARVRDFELAFSLAREEIGKMQTA